MTTRSFWIAVAAVAACTAAQAQGPTYGHRMYAGMYSRTHADLNNDGREDVVYRTQMGFAADLSTGP